MRGGGGELQSGSNAASASTSCSRGPKIAAGAKLRDEGGQGSKGWEGANGRRQSTLPPLASIPALYVFIWRARRNNKQSARHAKGTPSGWRTKGRDSTETGRQTSESWKNADVWQTRARNMSSRTLSIRDQAGRQIGSPLHHHTEINASSADALRLAVRGHAGL